MQVSRSDRSLTRRCLVDERAPSGAGQILSEMATPTREVHWRPKRCLTRDTNRTRRPFVDKSSRGRTHTTIRDGGPERIKSDCGRLKGQTELKDAIRFAQHIE